MIAARDLVEFFDAPAAASFSLAPEQALAFFRAKGLVTSFSWKDLVAQEHFGAFTIAKMADTDLLNDVFQSLQGAMESGRSFRSWADEITPLLQAKGWWGRQAMVDPLTGETIVAQLGSPGRLKTIFRTNMQSAYSVGTWERIQAQAEEAPYLLYDAVDDHRTRPEHAAWDGKVYPVDSPWWKWHMPPNGWNCRCGVIQLSQDDLADLGLEASPPPRIKLESWENPRTGKVVKHPAGVDPSFAYNPGELRMDQLAKLAAEKAAALTAEAAQKAASEGLLATKAAAEAALAGEIQAALKAMAKEAGTQELARANMKAAERAAQFALDDALAKKTPYLSKAIKDIQATKAGQALGPVELLDAAKAQAAKLKAQSNLSDWKKAYLADKAPSPAAQGAFDALPEDAQLAMKAQLDGQKAAAAAEKAAQAELAKYAAGDLGKLEAQTLAKLEAAPDFQGLTATEKVAKLQQQVAAQKAAISKATTLAGLKKSLVAGKQPTTAQAQLLDAMTPDEKAAFLVEVDKLKAAAAKAAKAAEPPPADTTAGIPDEVEGLPTGLNPADLVQIGGQGGSNPGGLFQDRTTGVKWYVKWPSEEMLRNEALANRLYAAAGVEVPEVRLIQFQGRPAIASRVIEGLNENRAALTGGRVVGVQEHFAVDAWLANWDVVGLSFDNLKLAAGRGVRIDPGGALRFRAQGGLKGAKWSDEVLDLDSLRDAGTNPQAAGVFKHVTRADIVEGVRRILSIPEARLAKLVDEFGPLDASDREALLARLLARREDLARKYPEARPQAPEPLPVVARVTRAEQLEIAASRANGYTMPTDGREIEDHHVVVMHYRDAKGNPKTRATLKLRPEAAARLLKTTGADSTARAEVFDFTGLGSRLETVLKSINARAAKGDVIPQHTADLALKTVEEFSALQRQLIKADGDFDTAEALEVLEAFREPMKAIAEQLTAGHLSLGAKAMPTAFFKFSDAARIVKASERIKPGAKPDSPFKWRQEEGLKYQQSTIRRGSVEESASSYTVNDARIRALRAQDGQDTITFVPDADDVALSARGYVQIDLDGQGEEVTARVFDRIRQLGIDSSRSTQADRLELYLDRHLYVRTLRSDGKRGEWQALDSIEDQPTRNARKTELLNKLAGFDVRTSRNWNPDGAYQAFGHGRVVTYRADFQDAELDSFAQRHYLYHNPVGYSTSGGGSQTLDRFKVLVEVGGQLASLMDRVRRGVPLSGSSVGRDLRTGGGNYVFTRIQRRNPSRTRYPTGFYFKPKLVARTDAFSYGDDLFGDVSPSIQRTQRAIDLRAMEENAGRPGNETNFKDSLSLFDDVEAIVVEDSQVADAIRFMRAQGYVRWPDGRALEDVILGETTAGKKLKSPP